MVKRIAALLLAVALAVTLLPMVAVKAEAAGKMTIEQLQAKFPNGKYWNGGNPNSYTSSACTHHSEGCTYSGSCGCNTFLGLSIQCMGYAEKLGYDFTGYNPRNDANGWKTYTSASAIDALKPGDIVRYGTGDNHSIFVTAVNGDTVTFTDCNYDGTCRIRWGVTISKKTLKEKIYHVRSAPFAISSANILSIRYNANGGIIPNSDPISYQYKVTDDDGLNMRSGAGTSYSKVTALAKDTVFTVNAADIKTANGYTWGKTTVGGKTGWVVISQYVSKIATNRATDFYLSSSQVCQTSTSSVLVHNMTYGTSYPNGLWDGTNSFKLTKEGYTFQGWSVATSGAEVFSQYRELRPEEIVPDLKNGNQTIVLYAIWQPNSLAVCQNGVSEKWYPTLNEALEHYDPACQYIKLTEDITQTVTLTKDLYIDLNGFDFTGTIDTAGYSIYGMDSTTDGYSCDGMGCFNCVDPQGNAVVPVSNVKTALSGSVKRYMTIATQQGYTFHRYYMGVTHMSIRFGKQSVGYKAVFAADPMVLQEVESFGYSLQLGDCAPYAVNCDGSRLASGKSVSLRVDGFDVEQFGQTDLTAQVFLTVNGETIYSSSYTSTLKNMVKAVDENIAAYTDAQIVALRNWLSAYESTKDWNLNNI